MSPSPSPAPPPRPPPRRRSTDTLDYYWSSLAGAGSSSSLARSLSPSPSPSKSSASEYSLPSARYDSRSSHRPPTEPEPDEFTTPVAAPCHDRPDLRPPQFVVPASSSPGSPPPQTLPVLEPVGDTPRSAPAHTSGFGGADGNKDWEETLRGRNRRTLPAKVPSSATHLAGLLDGSIHA